jgi:hypothetical protein
LLLTIPGLQFSLSLLLLLFFQLAQAEGPTTVSDDALRTRIAGTWQIGKSAFRKEGARSLIFEKNGTIRGTYPIAGSARHFRILVRGRWGVEHGKLVAEEEFSTGEEVHVVYEILGLTGTSMIVRADTGEVSLLNRK